MFETRTDNGCLQWLRALDAAIGDEPSEGEHYTPFPFPTPPDPQNDPVSQPRHCPRPPHAFRSRFAYPGVGLEPAEPTSGFLVSLPADPKYTNHLSTVHAAALFAVAEAGSGGLLDAFGSADGFVPVVRRVETKYRFPATGRVSARAVVLTDDVERWKVELASRGRLSATVMMEVVDETGRVVMTAAVEWFVTSVTKP